MCLHFCQNLKIFGKQYPTRISQYFVNASLASGIISAWLFFNIGKHRPLFVYLCPIHITIQIQIEKSIDFVIGISTWGRRMVGTEGSTEL